MDTSIINSEQMEFIDANGAAAAAKFKHAFEARCASDSATKLVPNPI
jgi:hypothetical protein